MTRKQRLRVLVLTDYYLPGHRGGGPIVSVSRIVHEESARADCWIVTRDRDLGDVQPFDGVAAQTWLDQGSARVRYLRPPTARRLWGIVTSIRGVQPDVVYLNSVFSPVFSILPLLLAPLLFRKPVLLVAPRGELHPGALSLKKTRKRAAGVALRAATRRRGVVWHASSEHEAADIERWLSRRTDVVLALDPSVPTSTAPFEIRSGPLRIMWVSRIVPKKNLHAAVELVAASGAPAMMTIYGPVEDQRYWAACQRSIAACTSATMTIRYGGELIPTQVPEQFRRHDVFVFPTLGENFGHVIAEALSVGCPVVTSTKTMWGDVLAAGAGLATDDREEAAGYIARLAKLDAAGLVQARERALQVYADWYERQSATRVHLFEEALALPTRSAGTTQA